jgi:hypothetical protein
VTDFEDRIKRMAREAIGRAPKPLGAGESQEQDEIRRALQFRFKT